MNPEKGRNDAMTTAISNNGIFCSHFTDFPGTCFASTRCATFEPGASWDLKPFCGRSTCVAQQGRLWELVEDCGPLPKPNPKCKLSDKTNKTADFPDCCPLFDCEKGKWFIISSVARKLHIMLMLITFGAICRRYTRVPRSSIQT